MNKKNCLRWQIHKEYKNTWHSSSNSSKGRLKQNCLHTVVAITLSLVCESFCSKLDEICKTSAVVSSRQFLSSIIQSVGNMSQQGQLPQIGHQQQEQTSVYKINYPLFILDKVEQLIRLTICELSQTVSNKLKGSFIICSSMSNPDTAST